MVQTNFSKKVVLVALFGLLTPKGVRTAEADKALVTAESLGQELQASGRLDRRLDLERWAWGLGATACAVGAVTAFLHTVPTSRTIRYSGGKVVYDSLNDYNFPKIPAIAAGASLLATMGCLARRLWVDERKKNNKHKGYDVLTKAAVLPDDQFAGVVGQSHDYAQTLVEDEAALLWEKKIVTPLAPGEGFNVKTPYSLLATAVQKGPRQSIDKLFEMSAALCAPASIAPVSRESSNYLVSRLLDREQLRRPTGDSIREMVDTAKLFAARGYRVNGRDDQFGIELIHRVAQTGTPDDIEALITLGCGVNARSNAGEQPLWYVKTKENLECLLKNGADAPAEVLVLALLQIAQKQGDNGDSTRKMVDTAKLLASKGYSVNGTTTTGRGVGLMHRVAALGTPDDIRALLQLGCGVNDKMNSGETPLWCVKTKENLECLLENGADATVRVAGKSILEMASESTPSVKELFVRYGVPIPNDETFDEVLEEWKNTRVAMPTKPNEDDAIVPLLRYAHVRKGQPGDKRRYKQDYIYILLSIGNLFNKALKAVEKSKEFEEKSAIVACLKDWRDNKIVFTTRRPIVANGTVVGEAIDCQIVDCRIVTRSPASHPH